MFSKHHPDGDGSHHLNNIELERLIAAYQSKGDVESLGAIVRLAQNRTLALIRFHRTHKYVPEDELLSDVNCKLLRSIARFDRSRGTGFTFLSRLVHNVLCTSVTNSRRHADRHVELDDNALDSLVTNGDAHAQYAVDDLADRIRRGVKTTLCVASELEAQRWYVESFISGAFELPRHSCANAAMRVFDLSHDRARELHDLTLLEIRRLLYDLKRHKPVAPGRLLGTRGQWILRYAQLMTTEEFTKFVALTRDLSPFVVLLSDPANDSRRQDRCAQIGRKNIEYVLFGHPNAKPLFDT
jgi:hypothetical protein